MTVTGAPPSSGLMTRVDPSFDATVPEILYRLEDAGCRAVIVMPVTTPRVKIDAVKALGGDVVLHGESYSDAYGRALELQRKRGQGGDA